MIEPESSLGEVLTVTLAACGLHELTVVPDAMQALHAVRDAEPDAVLIGPSLSVDDAADAARRLRARCSSATIVVWCADADGERRAAVESAGADAVCMRGLPVRELAGMLRMPRVPAGGVGDARTR